MKFKNYLGVESSYTLCTAGKRLSVSAGAMCHAAILELGSD